MTVASFLKQHGYRTACFGRWHLGWQWGIAADSETDLEDEGADLATDFVAGDGVDYRAPIQDGPTGVGFDYFYGIAASLDIPPYVYVENDRVTAVPDRIIPEREGKEFWREGPIGPDFAHEDVLPNLTKRVVSYIEESVQNEAPFFVYFPLPAPHTPILPTEEFQGKSGTNEYGDFCLQVDDVVGQVMDSLERIGAGENSILIFTSDNGCSPRADFEELVAVGHKPSYVFRGHKADIYEGGHRIPLVIRWPAQISAGSNSDETVCLADLLATCADMMGETLPTNAGEDSISNLPIWQGTPLNEPLREATVHTSVDGSLSIRQGRWKLEMCPGSGGWSFPRPGKECEGLPAVQLYDLEADIGERENVYAQHPQIVESLQTLLTNYVRNGRSTPGEPQSNTGEEHWEQLWWM